MSSASASSSSDTSVGGTQTFPGRVIFGQHLEQAHTEFQRVGKKVRKRCILCKWAFLFYRFAGPVLFKNRQERDCLRRILEAYRFLEWQTTVAVAWKAEALHKVIDLEFAITQHDIAILHEQNGFVQGGPTGCNQPSQRSRRP